MKNILFLFGLLPVLSWGQPIDTSIHVKSIYFGGGSYYLDIQQVEELYEWLDGFENIEQYEVIIQSHTDNIGSVEYNKRLSEMRSSAVWQKLLEYPLVPEAMEIKNFGEFLPTYSNKIHLGRLKNRRSDVILKPVSL